MGKNFIEILLKELKPLDVKFVILVQNKIFNATRKNPDFRFRFTIHN